MRSHQVEALAAHAHATFPIETVWKTPDGYPTSLGLCILDSIWSIGVNYDHHVIPVLNRYRDLAADEGRDASLDTPCDVATTIEELGGAESFARAVNSRHRTSSTNGILKAEAVEQAAHLFRMSRIATTGEFAARKTEVKQQWHQIRGQRSGVSWRYLLMLAGVDGIKPDRMIHGFIRAAIGANVTNEEAVELLAAVQQGWSEPRPTLLELDHAIWRYQSRRTPD